MLRLRRQLPDQARPGARSGALLGGGLARGAGLLLGRPGHRWGRPVGVIVTRPEPGRRALSVAVLREVAPAIGAVLERGSLLDRRAHAERSVTEASERRLTRLALDLHDGPLQNVAGIGGDLAMLRRRLHTQLEDAGLRTDLLSSIDDLEARLDAIDTELRDLSHSLESPAMPRRPFAEVLEAEAKSFRRHCDIRSQLELEGDLDDLTASQRIATWRIVQESLTNVREHSGASEVRVRAAGRDDRLDVEIVDDGCGFEVAKTLLDSAGVGASAWWASASGSACSAAAARSTAHRAARPPSASCCPAGGLRWPKRARARPGKPSLDLDFRPGRVAGSPIVESWPCLRSPLRPSRRRWSLIGSAACLGAGGTAVAAVDGSGPARGRAGASALRGRLASPADNAAVDSIPAFSWRRVSRAAHYEFQLSADARFRSTLASFETLNTSASVDETLFDGDYYWRVRAVDANKTAGRWSA